MAKRKYINPLEEKPQRDQARDPLPAKALGASPEDLVTPSLEDEATPPPIDFSKFGAPEEPDSVSMGEPVIEPQIDVSMGEPSTEDAPTKTLQLPTVDLPTSGRRGMSPSLAAAFEKAAKGEDLDKPSETDLFKLEDETANMEPVEAPPSEMELFKLQNETANMEPVKYPNRAPAASAAPESSIKEQVSEYLRSRPKRKDYSNYQAIVDAAAKFAGTTPGSFYKNKMAYEDAKQKDFDTDNRAYMDMVKQAIQNKFTAGQQKGQQDFTAGQNALNRDLELEKLSSEELRAYQKNLADAAKATADRTSREKIAEEARRVQELLTNRTLSVRQSEGVLNRGAADNRAALQRQNVRDIFNVRREDTGTQAMGKIDRSALEEAKKMQAAGKADPSLWSGQAGIRGAIAKDLPPGVKQVADATGISAAAAGGNQGLEFQAGLERSKAKLRHELIGSAQSDGERASIDRMYADSLSSNPEVAQKAFDAMVDMLERRVKEKEAAVDPKIQEEYRRRVGAAGLAPIEDLTPSEE